MGGDLRLARSIDLGVNMTNSQLPIIVVVAALQVHVGLAACIVHGKVDNSHNSEHISENIQHMQVEGEKGNAY